MPVRKSVILLRKNLNLTPVNDQDQEHWLYSESGFDHRGSLVEQTIYAQNGSIVEKTVNEYDEQGFLLREQNFVDGDDASEVKLYERNENGLVMKEFRHYIDGTIDTTLYKYDSQNRIISMITINDEGETEKVLSNEYRDDLLLCQQVLDSEGNLIRSDHYKYDDRGNSVEHKRSDKEIGEETFTVTKYNTHGRKQEGTVFNEDGDVITQTFYEEDEKGLLKTIREASGEKNLQISFTYDEHGNAIRQEETDGKGKQLMLVQREFDEQNYVVRSEVFVDGQGFTLPQHYEILFRYEFHTE